MTNKKMLGMLIGASVALVSGVGVFAASAVQISPPVRSTSQTTGTGTTASQKASRHQSDFYTKFALDDALKAKIDPLLAELKSQRKDYHRQIKAAISATEKEKLQSAWEAKKQLLINQIAALVPTDKQTAVKDYLTSKNEKKERGEKKDKSDSTTQKPSRSGKGYGVLRNFLDESQLTATQKSEIQLLQQQKSEQMKKLLEQLNQATSEADKTKLKAQMETLNQEFLSGLKKYIPAERVAEYEQFVSEAKAWQQKEPKSKTKTSESTTTKTTNTSTTTSAKTAKATTTN